MGVVFFSCLDISHTYLLVIYIAVNRQLLEIRLDIVVYGASFSTNDIAIHSTQARQENRFWLWYCLTYTTCYRNCRHIRVRISEDVSKLINLIT